MLFLLLNYSLYSFSCLAIIIIFLFCSLKVLSFTYRGDTVRKFVYPGVYILGFLAVSFLAKEVLAIVFKTAKTSYWASLLKWCRVAVLAAGWIVFFAAFFPVHFLLRGHDKWRRKIEVTFLSLNAPGFGTYAAYDLLFILLL